MQLIRTKGNVNKCTISREISRNSDSRNKSYKPDLAHRKYMKRIKGRIHFHKFDSLLQLMVDAFLKADFSPERDHQSLMRKLGLVI